MNSRIIRSNKDSLTYDATLYFALLYVNPCNYQHDSTIDQVLSLAHMYISASNWRIMTPRVGRGAQIWVVTKVQDAHED